MKKYLAYYFCTLLFVSCTDSGSMVTFDKAQPAGKPALTGFPKRLRGSYTDKEERGVLIIGATTIISVEDYDFSTAIKDLDSAYTLSGDTLIGKDNGTRINVVVKGDSIQRHIHNVDTFFNLADPEQVAKKFKGHYFLNTGSDKEGWLPIRLSLRKGMLIFAMITDSAAIANLRPLSENPADTVSLQFSISPRKFNTFNRRKGFTDADTFYKIRR